MTRTWFRTLVAGLLLGVSLSGLAQDLGSWRAASKTAGAITGDVMLSHEKILINFASFAMAQIRPLTPAEQGAVFASEGETAGVGNLYRINIPGDKRFQHKNTLCGSDDVQWMLTSVRERSLRIAFFSNAKVPVLTPEGMMNNTDLCGTFAYVR